MSLILTLVGLGLAIWALRLAFATGQQLHDVREVTGRIDKAADELSAAMGDMHKDLGDLDTTQAVKLDSLAGAIEDLQELAKELQARLPESYEPTTEPEVFTTPAQDPGEFERMEAIELDALDGDVAESVRQQAGETPSWALRRRGRGRPRWLVGVDDGRSWRVTRTKQGPKLEALPPLAYKVEPVALAEFEAEASEALVDATGARLDELDQTAFRRVSRGVPVYHVFAPTGPDGSTQVWRLVKTRWGWSAVPEGG